MNYKQQGMFDPLPHLIFKVHVFETLCYSVFFSIMQLTLYVLMNLEFL